MMQKPFATEGQLTDGTTLVKLIQDAGAVPGIKVDTGPVALPGFPGEVITQGLDGLRERFAEYHKLGARFAKWRAVIDISPSIPTYGAIHANAQAMARYAALAQEAGIVPIIEPEVLMDGDHDAARCEEVTTFVHNEFFHELFIARVELEGIILKPNMIVSGKKSAKQAGVQEVAERTLRVLRRTTPSAVPGVAFLSGGQSDTSNSTAHLDAMNKLGGNPLAAGNLLLWPRAAGPYRRKGLGRQGSQCRSRQGRLRPSRFDELECGPR